MVPEASGPAALVMEIGTDPRDDDGVVIVMWLSSITFRAVPDLPPNRTSVVPLNPDPVSVTTVPPSVEPEEGETRSVSERELHSETRCLIPRILRTGRIGD